MIPLTIELNKSYRIQKNCHICKKNIFSTDGNDRKYNNVRDQCHYTRKYRGAAPNVCDLGYKTPK